MEEISMVTVILNMITTYGPAIAGTIASATVITALTPTKVDDKFMAGFGRVINLILKVTNVLAGNILKNKNADDK